MGLSIHSAQVTDQLSDEKTSRSFSSLARLSRERQNRGLEIGDAQRAVATRTFLGRELAEMAGRTFNDIVDGWLCRAQEILPKDMGVLLPADGRQGFN